MSEPDQAHTPPPTRTPTSVNGLDGQISLLDNTKPQEDLEADDGPRPPLSHKNTQLSLREGLARRKYRKYQEERYYPDSKGKRPELDSRTATGTSTVSFRDTDKGKERDPDSDGLTLKHQESRLERGRKKIKDILRTKQQQQQIKESEEAIDVLFENQRGMFFFGSPLFSSQSLLNLDPSAWIDAQGHPSNVDITNAQVPDPSWIWAWNNWYVDMSRDVDEQGWQYSFAFQRRFPWHGTHPWLYSFVRRRMWLRKRVKHHRHITDSRTKAKHDLAEGHRLNPDYFTIHPARDRSPDSSYTASTGAVGSGTGRAGPSGAEEAADDIDTVQDLLLRINKATVDREKINAVLQFMEQGGEQIYYLADEIPHIMSLFIFQYTRRQLLASMIKKIEAASERRKENKRREEEEDDAESAKIDNLLKAVKEADKQIQGLEYWSDIREVVRSGEAFNAADETDGWEDGWKGLDRSGAAIPTLPEGGDSNAVDDGTALESAQEEPQKRHS